MRTNWLIKVADQPLGTHRNNNYTNVLLNEADDIQFKQKQTKNIEHRDLFVKLPAISLRVCNFTKNEFLHTCFSIISARFEVIIYCVLEVQQHLFVIVPFNGCLC